MSVYRAANSSTSSRLAEGTGEGGLDTTTADDQRPDTDLLQGPQDEGEGNSQAEIDALFD